MKQIYVIFSSGSTELSERIILNGYIAFEYFWYPRHYLGVASGHSLPCLSLCKVMHGENSYFCLLFLLYFHLFLDGT